MATYVDNKKLYEDICKWKAEMRATGEHVRMPDSIGKAIMDIAHGFSGYFKFSGYSQTWKEEMIDDAIEDNVKGLRNFDETKYKNPHAYITQACFNAFIQRIKHEKREQAVKYKYFVNHVYDESDEDLSKIITDENFMQDVHEKLNTYEASLNKPASMKKVYSGPTLEDFYG